MHAPQLHENLTSWPHCSSLPLINSRQDATGTRLESLADLEARKSRRRAAQASRKRAEEARLRKQLATMREIEEIEDTVFDDFFLDGKKKRQSKLHVKQLPPLLTPVAATGTIEPEPVPEPDEERVVGVDELRPCSETSGVGEPGPEPNEERLVVSEMSGVAGEPVSLSRQRQSVGAARGASSLLMLDQLPSDHCYASKPRPSDTACKAMIKRAARECCKLATSLPPGITLLAYESRLDLLRACFEGPADTPYEGGLFVFDLWLPPEYPIVPPHCFHWSFGKRLNPNLYVVRFHTVSLN